MENLGYYNGEIGLLDELKVPFLDRVNFFGDGVYDATITNKGVILFEDDHVDRFYNSCALMEIDPGISREDLVALLRELVAKVDSSSTFLYWQVTRGTAPRNHFYACLDTPVLFPSQTHSRTPDKYQSSFFSIGDCGYDTRPKISSFGLYARLENLKQRAQR